MVLAEEPSEAHALELVEAADARRARAHAALMTFRRRHVDRWPDPVLAALLKQLREQRGVTQERLAFDAGITASALSRIERGLNSPGWGTVGGIIHALGVSLQELGDELEAAHLASADLGQPRRGLGRRAAITAAPQDL